MCRLAAQEHAGGKYLKILHHRTDIRVDVHVQGQGLCLPVQHQFRLLHGVVHPVMDIKADGVPVASLIYPAFFSNPRLFHFYADTVEFSLILVYDVFCVLSLC